MKQKKFNPKVAFDIFYEQFKWSIWFLGILAAVHVIVLFFNTNNQNLIVGFFEFSRYSTAIFMLVCGIMAVYVFVTSHVQQGVTRKDVYLGIASSALGLALFLTLIALVLNGIEFLLTEYTALPFNFTSFGSSSEWLLETAIYVLNIFTCYLVGWLIGVGYYRFGWIIGFLFIAAAIIALSLNGYFWGENDINTAIPWIPNIPADPAPAIAITGSLVLIATLLAVMRLLTKRMAIKM
ncbi:hypothetical protein DHX103_11955 [Planococcus sp. X10-3]|uniref:hypothetical protein n=1 Tax=Planococcus sp. X10-3 TaxID=3061240 RepID=UPI003BAE5269